jgi:2,3-dihydroxyphenylpropionate 1,2-dioxygenase
MSGATPEVAQRLTHGRNPSREQRAQREANTVAAAGVFAAGDGPYRPLNPQWDALVLRSLAAGDFAAVDERSNAWFVDEAGHSAHEVRTWLAAYAALAAQGPYEVLKSYYRAIPEWFAGFATTWAVSR